MREENYTIGNLANETGCNVQTIRYYEKIGLMPKPMRTPGNQRIYGPSHVKRLTFIRHARDLGFPLDSIRELLDIGKDHNYSSETVRQIAQSHLEDVDSRINRLVGLKEELERMVQLCQAGMAEKCQLMRILAYHEDLPDKGAKGDGTVI